MKELAGKVAVLTGGASGIGRAPAEAFCREGMYVAIGDVEEPALTQAVSSLAREGASVIGVTADVSRGADVEALRDQALSAFGAVHVVCNNAGIATAGTVAGTPLERWRWTLDVNLWGVIHGCHAFLPLLHQQREGHIVNTASIAVLAGHPCSAPTPPASSPSPACPNPSTMSWRRPGARCASRCSASDRYRPAFATPSATAPPTSPRQSPGRGRQNRGLSSNRTLSHVKEPGGRLLS